MLKSIYFEILWNLYKKREKLELFSTRNYNGQNAIKFEIISYENNKERNSLHKKIENFIIIEDF